MFWDKWFKKNEKITSISGGEIELTDPDAEDLHTYKVAFNKLSDDQEEVYGFTIEFLKLFSPVDELAADAEFQLDFIDNEDIDYLIDALQQLKEK